MIFFDPSTVETSTKTVFDVLGLNRSTDPEVHSTVPTEAAALDLGSVLLAGAMVEDLLAWSVAFLWSLEPFPLPAWLEEGLVARLLSLVARPLWRRV